MTGFDSWASCSVTLMLDIASPGLSVVGSCCPVRCGGLVSLTCGMPPAIELSGIPACLGGGF